MSSLRFWCANKILVYIIMIVIISLVVLCPVNKCNQPCFLLDLSIQCRPSTNALFNVGTVSQTVDQHEPRALGLWRDGFVVVTKMS